MAGSFADYAATIDQTVRDGLSSRTDELARALLVALDNKRPLTVRIANVPWNDPVAVMKVEDFADEYGMGATLSLFGDRMLVQARVEVGNDAQAQGVQAIIEDLRSEYPGIETDLTFSDPGGGPTWPSMLEDLKTSE